MEIANTTTGASDAAMLPRNTSSRIRSRSRPVVLRVPQEHGLEEARHAQRHRVEHDRDRLVAAVDADDRGGERA